MSSDLSIVRIPCNLISKMISKYFWFNFIIKNISVAVWMNLLFLQCRKLWHQQTTDNIKLSWHKLNLFVFSLHKYFILHYIMEKLISKQKVILVLQWNAFSNLNNVKQRLSKGVLWNSTSVMCPFLALMSSTINEKQIDYLYLKAMCALNMLHA